jgi:hypothetical protein
MRVIITGGTGLIGRPLAAGLAAAGHEVIVLSRAPERVTGLPAGVRAERWDARSAEGWGPLADGAGAIVNLAGENIGGKRWTAKQKQMIIASRVNAGRAVVDAVRRASTPPRMVLQASGVGYYGPHGDEKLTEEAGPGRDWTAGVAQQWEAATAPVEELGVRRVVTRSGVVLSTEGGALPRMLLPFRFFAGGPVGSGRQWLSWVHLADQVAALCYFIETESARGVYNVAAPGSAPYAQVARAIGRAMHRPAFFPVPAFAVRLLFGEMATTVLDGQRVVPQRLQEEGWRFRFPDLDSALNDLLR